jgi:hypothetical protein
MDEKSLFDRRRFHQIERWVVLAQLSSVLFRFFLPVLALHYDCSFSLLVDTRYCAWRLGFLRFLALDADVHLSPPFTGVSDWTATITLTRAGAFDYYLIWKDIEDDVSDEQRGDVGHFVVEPELRVGSKVRLRASRYLAVP